MGHNERKKTKKPSFSFASLFKKKPQPSTGKPQNRARNGSDGIKNPYLNTIKSWNSYHQELLAGKRLWQFLALVCLMSTFAALAGVLYIGMQSKFIPYVVEVDKLGQAVAVSPAERSKPIDQRIIHAQLASFIHDLRLVTPDANLQTKAIHNVYSMLNTSDAATEKINEWYSSDADSTPFKRAENVTVAVNISSIIPQTPDTWQIDWIETVRERSGKLIDNKRMRALVTVYIVPPSKDISVEQIRKNPTNLYISDLSWSVQMN